MGLGRSAVLWFIAAGMGLLWGAPAGAEKVLAPAVTPVGTLRAPSISSDTETTPAPSSDDSSEFTEAGIYQLPPLKVVDYPLPESTGVRSIDASNLAAVPGRFGTLTDSLYYLPSVQSQEVSRSSFTQGEILPPEYSISGGRPYDSRYSLGGISINSQIDPEAPSRSFDSVNQVPSHSLDLFLMSELVEKVDVYEFNIPARLGEFTGGAVDAALRDPLSRRRVKFKGQTTRDSWASLHAPEELVDEFENSDTHDLQPRYHRYEAGVYVDLPLSSDAGALLAYSRQWSMIELQPFDERREQTRRLENFVARYVQRLDDVTRWDVSVVYTPYRALYFRDNAQNSDVTVNNDTAFAAVEYKTAWDWGEGSFRVGGSYQDNSRKAPKDYFIWKPSVTKPWGFLTSSQTFSYEGGYGDLTTNQAKVEVQADLQSHDLQTGPLAHQLGFGGGYSYLYGRYNRPEDAIYYYKPALDPGVVCGPNDPACIDGEQYIPQQWIYGAGTADAHVSSYAFYVEDDMRWWRLQVRPGMRFSYDSLLDNIDFASRLALSYDLLGNGETVVFGGLNRYYGAPLLAYKLREAIPPKLSSGRTKDTTTNELGDWTTPVETNSVIYRFADLKTPSSDEKVLGLRQGLWGGTLEVSWLERAYKDEFAFQKEKSGSITSYVMNNNGSHNYQRVGLSWAGGWGRHSVDAGVYWTESKGTYFSYDDWVDDIKLEEEVIYKGEIIHRIDLPQPDFNRTWRGTLVYSVELPLGLTFSNAFRYRSGYLDIVRVGNKPDSGTGLWVYDQRKLDDSFQVDWRLRWERQLGGNAGMAVTLDLYNVFDDVTESSGSGADSYDFTYDVGRQFWAGLEFWF